MENDGLSPGAVSQRLGVAVTTLRTWHQRYGLGPTGHQQGAHRRYAEADITRLDLMRRLTSQGVPAAEAARIARGATAEDTNMLTRARRQPTARAGGGATIAVGRAGPDARGLATAAARLDTTAIRDTIDASLRRDGVVNTWSSLLVPVLTGVGQRYAASDRMIEVEHLLSRCITESLAAVPRPRAQARILLACADEEQHTLALEALAAALAEQDIPTRLLGARVPPQALTDAIHRTGPAAVALWSQIPSPAHLRQLRDVMELTPRPALIIAAGPGWTGDMPPDAFYPGSLGEAVQLMQAVTH